MTHRPGSTPSSTDINTTVDNGLEAHVLWLDGLELRGTGTTTPATWTLSTPIGSSIIDLMQVQRCVRRQRRARQRDRRRRPGSVLPAPRRDSGSPTRRRTPTNSQTDSALYAAFISRHVLSDNPYCTRTPIGNWLGQEPVCARTWRCGRVSWRPPPRSESTMQNFIAFGGMLDLGTATVSPLTTGIDFLVRPRSRPG